MSEISDVLGAIESLHARGERMALATIVAVRGSTYRRPGARLLVPAQGELIGNISGGCLENDVADVARIVMHEGMARVVAFDLTADDEAVWGWGLGCNGAIELFGEPAEEAKAFIEVLEPPLRLLVCGAGHDAAPLVRAADGLGWRPIVVDDRSEFLNRDRFPEAAGFVELERPEDVAKIAPIDERTFVVVMTHNFLRDKDYVRSLLGSPARMIAMLGPGARTERLLTELREEGTSITGDDLARIHGPAGLDVGAEGPAEIAAAIVTEIVAVKRGREGGFLKHRLGPIHDRGTPARRSG